MCSLTYRTLLCVILMFNHFGCFRFETIWDNQVKAVTWLPEIPPLGDDRPLIVTVPAVTETFGCVYCFKNSPNFTCTSHGLYVAVFNLNGTLWTFDVYRTGESSSEGEDQRFKDFLDSIPNDKILSIALQGDMGSGNWSLIYTAVESAGGLTSSLLRNVHRSDAYAFITNTGKSGVTQERHVNNPYKMAHVETGFLHLEVGDLQFRVNSKVHSSSSSRKGVDFVVITEEVAHPILQLNANLSAVRPGDTIVITSNELDWTKSEKKVIAECSSCDINEIRLSEPLRSMHLEKGTFFSAKAPGVREDCTDFQANNIYITGYIMNTDVWAWSSSPSLTVEDAVRNNDNAPRHLHVGNCGHKAPNSEHSFHDVTGRVTMVARAVMELPCDLDTHRNVAICLRGRCLFTNVNILKNSYILYYHGRRFAEFPDDVDPLYLFHLTTDDDDAVWIDASGEDGSYGRLMNDNHINPNIVKEVLYVDDELHVAFYAQRNIVAGEELTFDYGGASELLFWRNPITANLSSQDQIRKKVIAPDYLYIGDCGSKGRGIFARVNIGKDNYVLYYHGRRYAENPDISNEAYLFAATYNDETVWIDAAAEDGSYGRLMNDDHIHPNIRSQVEKIGDEIHVAFYAKRDIMAAEELRFDYGGNPKGYSWRTQENNEETPVTANLSAQDQINRNVITPDYLHIGDCGSKGRGIFAKVNIGKDNYVLYYHGRRYAEKPDISDETYLFVATYDDETVWIDAAEEDGSYGRLMNDDHIHPNIRSKVEKIDSEIHVAFYAKRDITAGEELRYDYGGDPAGYFWRNLEQSEETPTTLGISNLISEDQIRKKVIAPDYLYLGNCGFKGRCIITRVIIFKDSYVLYYHGRRFAENPEKEDETYLFEVTWDTQMVWIDASEEDGSYGRLMNDDHIHPNIRSQVEYIDDEPHVSFYANRDIMIGEELRYDYGGDPTSYSWRVSCSVNDTLTTPEKICS